MSRTLHPGLHSSAILRGAAGDPSLVLVLLAVAADPSLVLVPLAVAADPSLTLWALMGALSSRSGYGLLRRPTSLVGRLLLAPSLLIPLFPTDRFGLAGGWSVGALFVDAECALAVARWGVVQVALECHRVSQLWAG